MDLTDQERDYLLKLLKLPAEYYATLAAHPRCSPGNREAWHLVNGLKSKLESLGKTK